MSTWDPLAVVVQSIRVLALLSQVDAEPKIHQYPVSFDLTPHHTLQVCWDTRRHISLSNATRQFRIYPGRTRTTSPFFPKFHMSCKRIIGTDFLNFILADTNYVTLRVKEKLVPILGTALQYHNKSTTPYRRTCMTCFWKTKTIPEILPIFHNR